MDTHQTKRLLTEMFSLTISCVFFTILSSAFGGPGSVVGIATGYGLDGPGIESRWGVEIFRTCPDTPWGRSGQWIQSLSRGRERPGCDAASSPPLVPQL